jgi:DNA processing protein
MAYIHNMDYGHLLRLSYAGYLSFREKYELITKFGNPGNIFSASLYDLVNSKVVNVEKAKKLLAEKFDYTFIIDMIRSKKIKLCGILDEDYPCLLKNIYAPPVLLYYKGELPSVRSIAIVGSRKTSAEGRMNALDAAGICAGAGFCVISGLARGIDSCAHIGALDKGKTAAVLGNGIDICYPPENSMLMQRIEEKGCLITEYPPGKKPSKYTFPARNRIISGLCEAVIVVEAAEKSGSLITADFALEQGRDVIVFKGKRNQFTGGTETLIKDGALSINSASELMAFF